MDQTIDPPEPEKICICGHPEITHDKNECLAGECYCVGFVEDKYLGTEIYLHEDFHDGDK